MKHGGASNLKNRINYFLDFHASHRPNGHLGLCEII